MKIQLLSDLHLEQAPDYQPRIAPGVDVLVLAGDIGSYQERSRLRDDDFGLRRFSPAANGPGWPRTLYVPGNHEFDALEFDATTTRLRALCAELGIEWLEREVIHIGAVRFVGTTLWSDFDALASRATTLPDLLRQRDKAFRAANYYLRKNTTLLQGQPMLAQEMRELALQCQAWLVDALNTPHNGPTVAVTHFAPSLRSADPRYGETPGTAGFCNSLDSLLAKADVWVHGHLHCAIDYTVTTEVDGQPHRCRVVANPLGYAAKGEQVDFRDEFVVLVKEAT
jgi:hypothetical protein